MEKNKTIKRLSSVLFAVLLIAALVLSVLTKGFTDWRFGKELPTVNDLNSNVVVTPQESGGAMTLSVMRAPEHTVDTGSGTDYESETLTITATVSPDNSADNTGLDWSMAFKNPSSEWATGKTLSDYMTLTPSGEDAAGSKTVSVKCLKPFGEQEPERCGRRRSDERYDGKVRCIYSCRRVHLYGQSGKFLYGRQSIHFERGRRIGHCAGRYNGKRAYVQLCAVRNDSDDDF